MASEIYLLKNTTTETPSIGYVNVYVKTDGRLYVKNEDGIEKTAGAGTDAENIVFTPNSTISATNMQAALEEVATELVAFTPFGTISATTVQAAIVELASETQEKLDLKADIAAAQGALSITSISPSVGVPYFKIPPRDYEINGVVTVGTGKWIDQYSSSDGRITSLTFNDLAGVGTEFTPSSMGALTTLSLPALTTVGTRFAPNTMAALTTLSLPALTTVGTGFAPSSMAALTTLSLPALTTVGSYFDSSSMGALTTLSLPALTTVGTYFSPNTMAALTTLSLPALTTVGSYFAPGTMAALTTLSLPALTTVGSYFAPNTMAALTTLSLPAIVAIGSGTGNAIQIITGMGSVTSFTLGSTLKSVRGNVAITSAALSQTSVNALLIILAALDGTNGTTAFSSRTVTITGTSATPSGAGLTAKATLVARGCTVTHN